MTTKCFFVLIALISLTLKFYPFFSVNFLCWEVISPSIRVNLSDNLCKSGPLHFGSENQFPSNFTHETILV